MNDKHKNLMIREMMQDDVNILHQCRLSQGWSSDLSIFEMYFNKHQKKQHVVFVAELKGQRVGYALVKPQADHGPFAHHNAAEIADFNVFEPYRGQGFGHNLLDALEATASRWSPCVTLSVGLHSGYGIAQRLYVKRGYILDGTGVWYRNMQLQPYAPCCNDDDLVLYLIKYF